MDTSIVDLRAAAEAVVAPPPREPTNVAASVVAQTASPQPRSPAATGTTEPDEAARQSLVRKPTPQTAAGGGAAAAKQLANASEAMMQPHPPSKPKSTRYSVRNPKHFKRPPDLGVAEEEVQKYWHAFFAELAGDSADEGLVGRCASLAARVQKTAEELFTTCGLISADTGEMCRAINLMFDPNKDKSNCAGHLGRHACNGALSLPPSQVYEFGDELGAGAYGSVFKAFHRATKVDHAMKAVPKDKVQADELWKEVEIMKQLDHPHLVRLYQVFEDEQKIYIALELCAGGGFHQKLCAAQYLPERTASKIFKQILSAVTYLHGKNICHRDLKPDNFLVWQKHGASMDSMHVKLNDFGTAKRFDLAPLVTKVCTICYVAPEVLAKGSPPYTAKVDCWSLGVMLYQMLSGSLPFNNPDMKELLRSVKRGAFTFEPCSVWEKISDAAKDLVKSLMSTSVETRLAPMEAGNHHWFSNRRCSEEDAGLDKSVMQSVQRYVATGRLKRVALQIIAWLIDDTSIERLRNLFLIVDKDCSGTLSVDELWDAVALLQVSEMERAGMVEVMRQLDPTGEDNVEYTDFLAATIPREQYLKDEVCKAAFMRLDVDNDGVLSRKDLSRLVADDHLLGQGGLSTASICERVAQLEAIFKEADEDGDGGISYAEFVKVMEADSYLSANNSALTQRRMRPVNTSTRRHYLSKRTISDWQELDASDVSSEDEKDE
eukprot:TRINITY_DN1226_c0_g2_i2.p1 TRINITY_DN1226_c0_g2~~TRINITY_DN1226_c0_g2_i2.p1  ORF type:complete len:718 (-),score=190.38 TRINITY_DN1226_c0_g2_i2:134-2287(-)